ncbi:unnamed protein product, partial [Meganyctiphanes norvegica]
MEVDYPETPEVPELKMEENDSNFMTPLLGNEEKGILESVKYSDNTSKKKILTTLEEKSKSRMERNIYAISISFCFLFACLSSLNAVQSSINKVLGNIGLSSIYISLVVSCTFFSTWVIKKFKVKKAMTICMLGYLPYFAVQVQPSLYTLVPAAFSMGLAAAPLWTSQCTYFTLVANSLSALTGEEQDVILTRFFGIFFLFFRSTEAVGNLVTSSVFSQDTHSKVSPSESALVHCGYNFCPAHFSAAGGWTGTSLKKPLKHRTMNLVSIPMANSLKKIILYWSKIPTTDKNGSREGSRRGEGISGKILVNNYQHFRHLILMQALVTKVSLDFFFFEFAIKYANSQLDIQKIADKNTIFRSNEIIPLKSLKITFSNSLLSFLLSPISSNIVVVRPRSNQRLGSIIIIHLRLVVVLHHSQIMTLYSLILPTAKIIILETLNLNTINYIYTRILCISLITIPVLVLLHLQLLTIINLNF